MSKGHPLITSSILTYEAVVGEEELRERLALEVLDQLGLLEDGKRIAGVATEVRRGDGHKPGYVVRVRRDMTKDTRAKLPAPKGDA